MKANSRLTKNISKTIFAALTVLAAFSSADAYAQAPVIQKMTVTDTVALGVSVADISMQRHGEMMAVKMDYLLNGTKMKGDRAIVYTPVLINGNDSVELNSLGLYGRVRWIQYQRNDQNPITGPSEMSYQYSKRPGEVEFAQTIPYADWMGNSTLVLRRSDYGCCRKLLAVADADLARWREIIFTPTLIYMRPAAAPEKHRELEGQAFIDFPVDQTIIYPNYRRNSIELDSIRATIDIVRNDPDATIETVWLKGFASPESPYAHNTDLAIGRTAALKKYIQNLYHFDGAKILTDYEPEDWEGLRKAVVNSNLQHRDEILALIDTDMNPDLKEARIKQLYPQDYQFMLQNFYPPLRHTNYKVSYTVRSYSDPREILEIMRTRPRNLDLDEFYIAASILEPGSDEFNEVFETAVRMYPNDTNANLNAANSALSRNDYTSASRYLAKAGNSPEADYARSVLNAMQGNYADAQKYLDAARKAGLKIADADINQLEELINIYSGLQK